MFFTSKIHYKEQIMMNRSFPIKLKILLLYDSAFNSRTYYFLSNRTNFHNYS